MTKERLQKILARAGYGSRRKCENFIEQGRVTVNGKTARPGQKADPGQDDIRFDGKAIAPSQQKRYILLNKPAGYLSSRRSQGGNPTVLALVDVEERVFPVGRLDLESRGLLLLTNDGELTNKITHPRYEIEKEYLVTLPHAPTEGQLEAWRRGVVLEDGDRTQPAEVALVSMSNEESILRVIIREGKKRHIRRTARALGLSVISLQRVRIGPLELGNLREGKWRQLKQEEINALRRGVREEKSSSQRKHEGR